MFNNSIHDEKDLFLKIAAGDEQAFTILFHSFTPKLIPFLLKLTRNEHLAREMIQETFLRLWAGREILAEIENPAGWIYRIASNVSLTYLKTQKSRKRLIQNLKVRDFSEPVSETVDFRELSSIIGKVVALLPEKRQEIYRLSREEGLNHQEIAQRLGLSIQTVKNQIGLSLKFIQEHIGREMGLSILTLMILFSR